MAGRGGHLDTSPKLAAGVAGTVAAPHQLGDCPFAPPKVKHRGVIQVSSRPAR